MKSIYSSCLLYELIYAISNMLFTMKWCCNHINCHSLAHDSVWCGLVSLERQTVPFMQHASVCYNISGFFLPIYLLLKEFFNSSQLLFSAILPDHNIGTFIPEIHFWCVKKPRGRPLHLYFWMYTENIFLHSEIWFLSN